MYILRATQSIFRLSQPLAWAASHGTRAVGISAQLGRSLSTTTHLSWPASVKTVRSTKTTTTRTSATEEKPTAKAVKSTATKKSVVKVKAAAKPKTAVVKRGRKPVTKTKKQIYAEEVAKRAQKRAERKELQASMPRGSPTSAFGRFFGDASKKPHFFPEGSSPRQRLVLCRQAWAELSEEEKRPFEEWFVAEREKYHQRRKEWLQSLDPKTFEQMNVKRRKAGLKSISKRGIVEARPLTPFFMFLKEFRARYTTEHGVDGKLRRHQILELTRVAGGEWRAMPEADKSIYHQASKAQWAKVFETRAAAAV